MPASDAERARQYRARQRAAKAQATLPTPEQIIEREEATEKVEQMSRAAGVPRGYPLSVWKRAAQHFIQGDGKIQAKVKALRLLCQSDNTTRKALKEWVKQDQSEACRKYVASQGWTLATEAARPMSLVDRMVACLEAGKRLEDHFTAEELNSPAEPDPAWEALCQRVKEYDAKAATWPVPDRKCGYPGCTEDFKTDFFGTKRCDKHYTPVAITSDRSSGPSVPLTPADYINSNFGKGEIPSTDPAFRSLHPQAQTLQLVKEAHENGAPMVGPGVIGRPMVGPIDYENSVFLSRRD